MTSDVTNDDVTNDDVTNDDVTNDDVTNDDVTNDGETIRRRLAPAVADLGLELYDVELSGSGRSRVLRVSVADPVKPIDLDALTRANRALGPRADELIDGHYELEVSSPGVERALRRPEHYHGALGETVTVKHRATDDGATVRERARLVSAGDDSVVLELESGERRTVPYAAISAARTVFEWGAPEPAPSKRAKEQTIR